jgi:O-methyltransferase
MIVDSLLPSYALAELLELARSAPAGNFAEFGVYKGGAAQHLATIACEQGRRLYLFDTFTGIPYAGPHDSHAAGDFGDTSLEAVRELIPDATIVPGIFPQSLAVHRVQPEALAFVHVDADQYESLTAAAFVFPRFMVRGGLMLFDDYGIIPGATKAVHDWGQPIEITRAGKALWRRPLLPRSMGGGDQCADWGGD